MSNLPQRVFGVCAIALVLMSLSCDDQQGAGDSRHAGVSDGTGSESLGSKSLNGTSQSERIDPSAMSGESGDALLARGTVRNADGSPCPAATVTLEWDWDLEIRFLTVKADQNGDYAVYGPSSQQRWGHPVWAATDDGRLGVVFLNSPRTNAEIKLYGGQTTLYVRDKLCKPIANALVDVYLSSWGDMAENVPPNIREMLKRETDENGTASWPSSLGSRDLGFEVTAPGYETRREGDSMAMPGGKRYYGEHPHGFYSSIKVLVLDGDHRDFQACAEMIEAELASKD